jgi:peptidoglycan hydrolase CwlO-like protein
VKKGETMRRIFAIAITVLSLAIFFPITVSASDNNQKSQTKYDYVKHSHDNYQKSLEKYQKNPTNQNRQIMKQRKQIYEMRKKQFGRDTNK